MAASALLPLVSLGVSLAGFERMRRLLGRGHARPAGARAGPEADARARIVARMVGIAGRRGPVRAPCVPRSLLAWWWLRREGIETSIRVGVARDRVPLRAHAWVEREGLPLGEDGRAADRFAAFDADFGASNGGLS